MGQRRYGQYCGLAHAVDLVGERWALLIVRDLLVGPKRFTDLHRGLVRIPTNILSARLKQLEADGIVRRRVLPRPASAVVYELTEYGRDLEDIVFALGRWGARTLGEPRENDVVTTDSVITALRATFRPERARGVDRVVELHVADVVVTAGISGGVLTVSEGGTDHADAVVKTGPALRAVLAGELTPEDAVVSCVLAVSGDESAVNVFGSVFAIDPAPQGAPASPESQHGQ